MAKPEIVSKPNVLALHSSTSSSKQWTRLTERLNSTYRVITPDLIGYGKSDSWSDKESLELKDEIKALHPYIDSIPGSFHLIGHSYGGAVAFTLAMMMPERIRSLIVYEPVLFNLLFEQKDIPIAGEIWIVQDDVFWLLVDDRLDDASRRFIDYWSGEGMYDRFPDWQKEAVKKRIKKVKSDFDATLTNQTPLCAYRNFKAPTLLLYGLHSPPTTQKLVEWLGAEIPHAEVRGFLPLGHMGPVTNAVSFADICYKFLENQPKGILPHQITFRKDYP